MIQKMGCFYLIAKKKLPNKLHIINREEIIKERMFAYGYGAVNCFIQSGSGSQEQEVGSLSAICTISREESIQTMIKDMIDQEERHMQILDSIQQGSSPRN